MVKKTNDNLLNRNKSLIKLGEEGGGGYVFPCHEGCSHVKNGVHMKSRNFAAWLDFWSCISSANWSLRRWWDEEFDGEGDLYLKLDALYIAPKNRAFGGAKDHAYHILASSSIMLKRHFWLGKRCWYCMSSWLMYFCLAPPSTVASRNWQEKATWHFQRGDQRDGVKMMMMKMFMPSMPSMPGGGEEKKEETAESREEAKEQVGIKFIKMISKYVQLVQIWPYLCRFKGDQLNCEVKEGSNGFFRDWIIHLHSKCSKWLTVVTWSSFH